MKIVLDMQIPYVHGLLERYAEVIYLDGSLIHTQDLMDADALLVRTRTFCNQDLLMGTAVRFVGTATIGTEHIDTNWCDSHGVHWVNAPGCNSNGVANYVIAALLQTAVKHGISLADKTLGVVGVGAVGSKVANYARALGMRVLLNDPPRAEKEGSSAFCSLAKVLAESDFLTFHVPLEKSGKHPTWRIVNSSFLRKLPPFVWLINSSRGAVVDNTALRIALRSNSIAGAILDVWEGEPESIDQNLLSLVEIATPHIAGYSMEGKANASTQIVQQLGKFFNIPDLVNWQVPASVLGEISSIHEVHVQGKLDEQVLLEVVQCAYNILEDDCELRNDSTRFEELRNKYLFRREFQGFAVRLNGASDSLRQKVAGIGFRLV